MTGGTSLKAFFKNVTANWLGYGANVVVAFALAPYVVRSLGADAYGVWSVMNSVTGYLGLADIGVRISTGRFINYHLGRDEREEAGNVVATSLVIFTALSALLMVLSVAMGIAFPRLFPRLPLQLSSDAVWVLPVLCLNLCMALFTSTFAQILTAANRFPLKNGIDLLTLVVRSVLTVLALSHGYGFGGLALATFVASVVQMLVFLWLAHRSPLIPVGFRGASYATASRVMIHSGWSFVFNAGARLVNYTDTILIAALLGATEVAVYSIVLMIITSGISLVGDVADVMTPDIYKRAGKGEREGLHEAIITGARRSMFVAIPLLIGIVTMGKDFIALWMGDDFRTAALPLAILAIGFLLTAPHRACGAAAWGLGEVKQLAKVKILEGIANLVLSIAFARFLRLGVVGVALGTLVPMVLSEGVYLPVFACRLVNLDVSTYVRRTAPGVVGVGLVFFLMCQLANSLIPAQSWLWFLGKVSIVSTLYVPLGLWFILRYRPPVLARRASAHELGT